MSSRPDLAELAAKALAAAPEDAAAPSPARDAQAVARLAAAIRERRRSARRWPWMAGGAVAVAAAAVVLVLGHVKKPVSSTAGSSLARSADTSDAAPAGSMLGVVDSVIGEAFVLHGGQSRSVVNGNTVAPGDRIMVPHAAGVAFALPTGTRLTVEDGGDITIVAQGATQLFGLAAGSVRAEVHKLAQGERFLVRTPDAEIEVHGTSFRVANVDPDPSCGEGTTTRLTVFEGVVTVRAGAVEATVAAGHLWPDCSGPATAKRGEGAAPAVPASAKTRRGPTGTQDVPTVRAAPPGQTLTASQLAEQNDLYARAVEAREHGDSRGAIATFERLTGRFPSGPLAENAAAERMILLEPVEPHRAAQAAQDYLYRYPVGFARSEAQAIVARDASRR